MKLNEYQKTVYNAVQPHDSSREEILHWTLGLVEEAGEVASLIKHKYFNNQTISDSEIVEELGDLLWYLAAICTVLNIDFMKVAEINIAKLNQRFRNGVYTDEAIEHRHDNDNVVKAMADMILASSKIKTME